MKDMHILQSKNAHILNFGFDNGLLLGTYVQEAHKSNDDDGVHARVCVCRTNAISRRTKIAFHENDLFCSWRSSEVHPVANLQRLLRLIMCTKPFQSLLHYWILKNTAEYFG